MYYNISIKYKIGNTYQVDRKVSKVKEEKLIYFINLYLTNENEIIITEYNQ